MQALDTQRASRVLVEPLLQLLEQLRAPIVPLEAFPPLDQLRAGLVLLEVIPALDTQRASCVLLEPILLVEQLSALSVQLISFAPLG